VSDAAIDAIVADWKSWAQYKPRIIGALNGGLSNSSVLLQIGEQRCVLRLNGRDSEALAINRRQEASAHRSAAQQGLAPALLYQHPHQRFQVSEYLQGRNWTEADLSDPSQLNKLAGLLASIHNLPVIEGALDIAAKVALYKQYQRYDCAALVALTPAIDAVVDTVVNTNSATEQHCLCHGDLLAANIVERQGRLWALDWEYAAMTNPCFDLAVVLEGQSIAPSLHSGFLDTYKKQRPQTVLAHTLVQWRIVYSYLDVLWYALRADNAVTGQQVEHKVAQLALLLGRQ